MSRGVDINHSALRPFYRIRGLSAYLDHSSHKHSFSIDITDMDVARAFYETELSEKVFAYLDEIGKDISKIFSKDIIGQ